MRGRVALGVASLLGLAFGWAGFFGARQPIVARVADWRLGVGDLETEIAARSADGGGQYGTLEARASLVRALVERKMLAEAARRAGYADDPRIAERIEQSLAVQYLEDRLAPRLTGIDVDPADVERAYLAERASLTRSEQARVAVVLVDVSAYATAEAREAARMRAERARADATGLADEPHLGAVAARYSDDRATRYLGGDAGWIARRDSRFDAALVAAAFELGPGELTPVVETVRGFGFAKLIDRRVQRTPTLEEVGPSIRRRLLDERRQHARDAFLAEVAAETGASIDEVLLASLPAPTAVVKAEPQPPPLPGG